VSLRYRCFMYRLLTLGVSPWTEADGKDVVFIALKKVACGTGENVQRFAVWLPYNTAAKKQLDFYRITPLFDAPVTGKITMVNGEVFLDGKKCVDWPGPEN
jgi:hypothetical protein